MRKGYVETPIGQVHYREAGEGPPLLLLHQTAWSSIQFRNAMAPLASRGVRAIAIDTPGYGMSDNFDHPPSIIEYATVLSSVMDGLGLTKASIAGHHTGASIGAAFASRNPARVQKLVMHGVPLYTPERRAERLAQPHFDQTPKADGSHLSSRFQRALGTTPKASLEAVHWSTVNFYVAGPTEWYGHHAAFKYDMAADLTAIKSPTLIISNTGDTLHAMMPQIQKMRPDFTYKTIEGGTFHIVFDDGANWANVVADYIVGVA
ncbi:MAG: alpha/beta hydrolase [Alphaproteobacteria bacterium]|nr:alpha/beta hydrolase [Alphaproteobacteria bacterium]